MFALKACAERYWAKIEINERMRSGYPPRIGNNIYALGQRLLYTRTANGFLAVQIASAAMALTTYKERTFADFLDEAEESENHLGNFLPDSEENPWKSNEVLKQINRENWEITQPHESVPDDGVYGVMYGRYSSDNQDETGCISRIKSMLDTAEEMEVPLYTDPVVDVASSGKKGEQDGLEEIVRLVQHPQVQYLFVHSVDRIARWNSFCLFLVEVFTRDFDVTVVTDEGELDLDQLEGLATTWVTSMAGEIENRQKAKHTLGGQIEQFTKGNYESWFNKIPIGYTDSDEKLLEKDGTEVEIVKAMFRLFANAADHKPYEETSDKINSQYSQVLDEELKYDWLKKMLQNPVYIGKPTVSGESIGDDGQEATLDRPELQIIDRDLFEQVNQKIERIENQQSQSQTPGEEHSLEYIMFEFGLLPLVESSPDVAVVCPECDSKMVRDGTQSLDNIEKRVPIYKCMECAPGEQCEDCDDLPDGEVCEDCEDQTGTYKTYPNSLELYKIKLFDKVLNNLDKIANTFELTDI